MKNFILRFLFLLLYTNVSFSQGYICAVGGGTENYNDWSDAPYRWIVQKSDSGKIIILSYADATTWLPNYFMWLGADTAYNKTISSTTIANLQSTYDELITAKAIFLRGGDQWQYIRLWKGTKTEEAIRYVFQNGGVIAGTSAGAMVLGEFDFSAQSGSAYPDEALQNPFYVRMRFENNFLNLSPNILFDTHMMERGRHGRLIAMVYNLHFTYGKDIIGVGIDDRTAICISPDGIGEVMGSGSVSIFYKDDITRYSAFTSGKYTIENLKAHVLTRNWKFDFVNKQIFYIPPSAKDVDTTRSWGAPLTDIYLTGSNNISAQLNTHVSNFLSSVNSDNVVILTHPGFTNSISALTNYLSNNGVNYSIVYLTSANLNNQIEANKILSATCFVFAGDSLNVLAYLNQSGTLLFQSFYSSVVTGKPIFFFGNSGKISGEKYVGNTDTDIYASYQGRMIINNGLNLFGDLIFQPLVFDDPNFYENRMSAVLWGMMRNRKRLGLYLNSSNYVKISSSDKSITGVSTIPYLIVNARDATKVDSSTYRASNSIGPRQVVAFDHLRFSLTNYSQIKYLIEQGKFDYLIKVDEDMCFERPTQFMLEQNYPNPFNPSTRIKYQVPTASYITLKVYDILGNEVVTLVDEYKPAGSYVVDFNVEQVDGLCSGVYFYQLRAGEFIQIKKMMLIK